MQPSTVAPTSSMSKPGAGIVSGGLSGPMNAMIRRPTGGETTAVPKAATDAAVVSGPMPKPIPTRRAAQIATAGSAIARSGWNATLSPVDGRDHAAFAWLPAADAIGYLGSKFGGVPGSVEPWLPEAPAPCGLI